MARAIRLSFEDAIYHLCARGNRRERIFELETDYRKFEKLLGESVERYQVELYAYVLLPNHFHLLACTLKPNLSRWMHWLITNYSLWFNQRRQLPGHVFQGRFKSFLVQNGSYLLELSRYLHLNPVRGNAFGRGDVQTRRRKLRGYKWSSYLGYSGFGPQKCFITENAVLGEFDPRGRTNRQVKTQYRRFVEESLFAELANPFERVRWQSVLGDEPFCRRLRESLVSKHDARHEITAVRQALRTNDPAALIERVAEHYAVSVSSILERHHGSEPRNAAIWLLRQKTDLTLREIGTLFGGMDYAAVSDRIRRMNKQIQIGKRGSALSEILNL